MIKRFKGKDLMMIVQNEINEFIRMIGCSRYVTATSIFMIGIIIQYT
jgi:hypothetical protein